MMKENELLELSKYIVEAGLKKGASAVEVLAHSISDVDVNIESSEISGVEKTLSDKIAIRLYLDKRMGAAFTNIPTEKAVEEAMMMALASTKVTTEDNDWVALPEPNKYSPIEGLWDEEVADCEPSKVVEIAGDFMSKALEAESGLIAAYGAAGVSVYHTAYANSSGIEHSEKGDVAYAVLGAIAQIEGGVTPMILAFDARRNMDLELDKAVDDIARMIRVCKNHTDGKSGKHIVAMHPWAYGQIFGYTLMESVKGDNIARGKSKLEGRIGDAMFSEKLTLIDDGTHLMGLNTSVADDEGVPRQKTPIIEDGVLKSFIWDTYWANKMGEVSTGNARRNMRQGLVHLATTNMVIKPGIREIEDVISEIDNGYLIRNVQGAHSSNPESGDFSVVGNPAILIDDGEMVGAIHGLMISGNAFELLNQVSEVAKTPLIIQGVIGPEIVFEDVRIITRY